MALAALDHVGKHLESNVDVARSVFLLVPIGHNTRKIGHRRQKTTVFLIIDVYAEGLNSFHVSQL